MVLVRNVEGNVGVSYTYSLLCITCFSNILFFKALSKDLSQSLFNEDSFEASRLKVQVSQNKHLIISGGHWKNNVIEWLKDRGF